MRAEWGVVLLIHAVAKGASVSVKKARKTFLDIARETPTSSSAAGLTSCKGGMVFDIGLPRTGTTSISAFGASLGFLSQHITDVPFSKVERCKQGLGCRFYTVSR